MQQQQKLRERVDDLEMQGADSAASDSLLSDKKEVEAKCKKLEKELQVSESAVHVPPSLSVL